MNEKQIYEAWEDCRREMDGKITLATAQEIAELKAAGKLPDTRPHVLFRHRIVAGSYDEAKRKHDMLIGCGDYGPDSLVRPYPEPGDVFGEPLELHKKHFMPFVSIHSSLLWDDVDTWLHFVTPFEPLMEDYIGSFTEPYHDFYNKELQVSLAVKDGQYTFAGDWNYFALESGVLFEKSRYSEEENRAEYQSKFERHEEWRANYLATGEWFGILQLGGEPTPGNLYTMVDNVRNKRGTAFRFVGEVQCVGADATLLFFDPEESVAVVMCDFT